MQLYKNNARALLLRILSILNLDWLRSVRGVYELTIRFTEGVLLPKRVTTYANPFENHTSPKSSTGGVWGCRNFTWSSPLYFVSNILMNFLAIYLSCTVSFFIIMYIIMCTYILVSPGSLWKSIFVTQGATQHIERFITNK